MMRHSAASLAMVLGMAAAAGALDGPRSAYGEAKRERPEDVKREKLDKAARKRQKRAQRDARNAAKGAP